MDTPYPRATRPLGRSRLSQVFGRSFLVLAWMPVAALLLYGYQSPAGSGTIVLSFFGFFWCGLCLALGWALSGQRLLPGLSAVLAPLAGLYCGYLHPIFDQRFEASKSQFAALSTAGQVAPGTMAGSFVIRSIERHPNSLVFWIGDEEGIALGTESPAAYYSVGDCNTIDKGWWYFTLD